MCDLVKTDEDFDLHSDIRLQCHTDPVIVRSELIKNIRKNKIDTAEWIEQKLQEMILECPSRNFFGS